MLARPRLVSAGHGGTGRDAASLAMTTSRGIENLKQFSMESTRLMLRAVPLPLSSGTAATEGQMQKR